MKLFEALAKSVEKSAVETAKLLKYADVDVGTIPGAVSRSLYTWINPILKVNGKFNIYVNHKVVQGEVVIKLSPIGEANVERAYKSMSKLIGLRLRTGVSRKLALLTDIRRIKNDIFVVADASDAVTAVKSGGKAPQKSASLPTKKPAAQSLNKAPRGTGKLKSFMKENGIDAKTLRAMLKHL